MTEPATKIQRMDHPHGPAPFSDIHSISNSLEALLDTPPIKIEVATRKKDYFFQDSQGEILTKNTDNLDIDCSQWEKVETSEKSVRDDVYTVLKNHQEALGIVFPDDESTCSTVGSKHTYSEKHLKTIFLQHTKNVMQHELGEIDERQHGLCLKLSSRPDLCVLRCDKREIVVGEIKQMNKYHQQYAAQQCALYCFCVLYYYKAILGIPIERAFGFWLCGPNCKDLKNKGKYAVGIMEVRGPEKLGDIFKSRQYSEKFDLSSKEGICLLMTFFKDGNHAHIAENKPKGISEKLCGPYCFALPPSLWKYATESSSDSDISIVRGGTAAMIFKLPANKISCFIDENVTPVDAGTFYWTRFTSNIKAWEDKQKGDQEKEKRNLLVKVRTRHSSFLFRDGFTRMWCDIKRFSPTEANENEAALQDFLSTYILEPYEDHSFSICVMADRGTPLRKYLQDEERMRSVKKNLKQFKDHAFGLSDFIIHGDVLMHNVVIDCDDKLCLVDYDESFRPSHPLPKRADVSDDIVLYYPNALRCFGRRYTQVQLIAFFAALGSKKFDQEFNSNLGALTAFLKDATRKNEDYNTDNGIPPKVEELINSLWETVP